MVSEFSLLIGNAYTKKPKHNPASFLKFAGLFRLVKSILLTVGK